MPWRWGWSAAIFAQGLSEISYMVQQMKERQEKRRNAMSRLLIAALVFVLLLAACGERPLVYKNEEYGFSLTFPETWEGYEVTVHPDGTVCFSFDRPLPLCILQLYIRSKDEWNDMKESAKAPAFIGESEEYVFLTDHYSSECVQMDEFQCERHHEVPSIVETFKLTE